MPISASRWRLFTLYSALARMRDARPALRSGGFYPWPYDEGEVSLDDHGYGVDSRRGLVVFHRWGPTKDATRTERIVVVLNFSDDDHSVDIPFPTNGPWTDLLSGTHAEVSGWLLPAYTVNSHWGRVFTDVP